MHGEDAAMQDLTPANSPQEVGWRLTMPDMRCVPRPALMSILLERVGPMFRPMWVESALANRTREPKTVARSATKRWI